MCAILFSPSYDHVHGTSSFYHLSETDTQYWYVVVKLIVCALTVLALLPAGDYVAKHKLGPTQSNYCMSMESNLLSLSLIAIIWDC